MFSCFGMGIAQIQLPRETLEGLLTYFLAL